jgi:glycosyltransferase involved in cell wall biosynthesis
MNNDEPLVLHVIPGLGFGGAEQVLASLVTAKRSQPFQQVVIDLLGGGALSERIRAAGIPVYDLNLGGPAGTPLATVRLARLIQKIKPTTIQSWLYYGDILTYWALKLSGRRTSTRLYWGIRCSELELDRYSWLLRRTINACARRSGEPDAVVANSFAGREVHRQLGYKPRAFPVIPNGVDTSRFKPDAQARKAIRSELGIDDETPLVLHVARVDPMKDHAGLLTVAGMLPKVTFVMAGAHTNELKTPVNVKALGIRSDMPSIYAAADIAVSASAFGEGFSNAIAEAMASGVPVISTDVGDARAIVNGTGIIVPPRDPTQMADSIASMLGEMPDGLRSRGSGSRDRILTNYSLDLAVATFDSLHVRGALPNN